MRGVTARDNRRRHCPRKQAIQDARSLWGMAAVPHSIRCGIWIAALRAR
jgi:hypothetical protein